jgi:hypothetical protein
MAGKKSGRGLRKEDRPFWRRCLEEVVIQLIAVSATGGATVALHFTMGLVRAHLLSPAISIEFVGLLIT